MYQKSFHLETELLKIARICLGVFFTFIFFGLILDTDRLSLYDPKWMRWIHLIFISLIFLGSYWIDWVRNRIQYILHISFYTMSIHSFLILYWNGLHISYLIGMVLVISCIGISFVNQKWLAYYLLFVILVSIPVGVFSKDPTVPVYLFYPTIITPAIVSYLTLNVRLGVIEKLKESELILSQFYYRISLELEQAQKTQKSLIRLDVPEGKNYKMSSYYKSYEKVGGDVLSLEERQDGKLNILFADISGHGISSAMVSAMATLAFKIVSKANLKPAEALLTMHELMKPLVIDHHISACFLVFDPKSNNIEYSYAGHHSILLIRNGNLKELEGRGTLILSLMKPSLQDYKYSLEKGDRLLMFSDGLYELFNTEGEFYGEENLYNSIRSKLHLNGTELLQSLVDSSLSYANFNAEDDMTLFSLEIVG
jgi:serine phosphatase RsbU (regulator of sigma subunit)